jgi:hypothetical protein
LKSLSPLSGHYRPPAWLFRKFLHSLREEGADISGVTISKSYATLLGLEAWGNVRKGKKKMKAVSKKAEQKMISAGVGLSKQDSKNENMAEKKTAVTDGPPPPTADDSYAVTNLANKEQQIKANNGFMARLLQKRTYRDIKPTLQSS